jgi:hypothetical protein
MYPTEICTMVFLTYLLIPSPGLGGVEVEKGLVLLHGANDRM